ncbi:MAG: alpha/beta fold hydrolase [Dehalococcoidia bacterium]
MFGRKADANSPLAVTIRDGPGPTLLLLHGLTGSSASWMRLAPLLPAFRLVIPDLLGFGRSPKPDSPYDLDAHCAALAPIIAQTRPVAAIGHSMGGVIALALLQRCPEIGAGVLICPALYESREQALAVVEHAPWLQRLSLHSPRMARVACEASCMLRPVLRPIAPLFVRDLPAAVVRAGLDHTWTSYSRSLDRVVLSGLGRSLVSGVGGRVTLVHASEDATVPRQVLEPYAPLVKRFVVIEGGHEALLTRAEAVAHEVVTSMVPRGRGSI